MCARLPLFELLCLILSREDQRAENSTAEWMDQNGPMLQVSNPQGEFCMGNNAIEPICITLLDKYNAR